MGPTQRKKRSKADFSDAEGMLEGLIDQFACKSADCDSGYTCQAYKYNKNAMALE